MTNYPPNFISKVADKSWDEGFKAGIQEVIHELETRIDHAGEDAEAPTKNWVQTVAIQLVNKYS
jgi:hypothetical protein